MCGVRAVVALLGVVRDGNVGRLLLIVDLRSRPIVVVAGVGAAIRSTWLFIVCRLTSVSEGNVGSGLGIFNGGIILSLS